MASTWIGGPGLDFQDKGIQHSKGCQVSTARSAVL
jgi:hypothetical protein